MKISSGKAAIMAFLCFIMLVWCWGFINTLIPVDHWSRTPFNVTIGSITLISIATCIGCVMDWFVGIADKYDY